jgi:ABC-type uncharacterized transport system permease subunit
MMPYRLVLSPRLAIPRGLTAATLVGGIAFGLFCCAIFLIAFGVPASDLANQFILYVFGNSAGLDQTLTRAISLVLVSLSVALCLRIRFWNIGVEGQLWMGAIELLPYRAMVPAHAADDPRGGGGRRDLVRHRGGRQDQAARR